jgi:hypothetical protein
MSDPSMVYSVILLVICLYSCHIQNTVSVNASGKERLILDLRHIDQFIENRKYKFEGVPENLYCVINTTRILVISTFLYTGITLRQAYEKNQTLLFQNPEF